MTSEQSPYVFRASAVALRQETPSLALKEAHMLDGMALRYQERQPGPLNDGPWCETGHSIFLLRGRLRYEFPDHVVELDPGDMAHIPAGHAHRHRPTAIGDEAACYYLTEFE